MATGWAHEGAVLEQIDATIADAIARARRQQAEGPGLEHCAECGEPIPEGRRRALPGVRFCVMCQTEVDRQTPAFAAYNRRGSKDSQLR